MLTAIIFPGVVKRVIERLAKRFARRSLRAAERMEKVLGGVDRAHACMIAFGSPKGLLTLLLAIVISAPSHANKLLAGYVTMRILGIPADFTDILLLQTLISFLLYFAPTPGGSGLAELTSAAVMSIYVSARVDAELHADLALHQQLRNGHRRLADILVLAAERADRA